MTDLLLRRGAVISPDGKYRYRLIRYWGPGPMLPFVMLNPSTADAEVDDPTIRRCMGFARREGLGGIIVANLYAYRAAVPKALLSIRDPSGPGNGEALWEVVVASIANGCPIVCAWGAHKIATPAALDFLKMGRGEGADLRCLGETADGHPRHPLYVRGDQSLEKYSPFTAPAEPMGPDPTSADAETWPP